MAQSLSRNYPGDLVAIESLKPFTVSEFTALSDNEFQSLSLSSSYVLCAYEQRMRVCAGSSGADSGEPCFEGGLLR